MLCQNKYTQSIVSCPLMIHMNSSHILTCYVRSILIVSISIPFNSVASVSLLFISWNMLKKLNWELIIMVGVQQIFASHAVI